MLQEFKNGCCRYPTIDCFRVVGLGLYLDSLFGTKYSSFHKPNICSSVFGRVFWRERRKGLGHIVRFLPRTDMSAALQKKNHVEVKGMISALQCRHLFASKKYSFQLTLVHRRVSSPAIRLSRHHRIWRKPSTTGRFRGISLQLHYPRMLHEGNLIHSKRAFMHPIMQGVG